MALLPTIPTSFVPRAASAAPQRFRGDVAGAFGFFAYAVLGIVFILAIAVFFYGRILTVSKVAKDKELAEAQAAIDPATVQNFVRLRDRLSSGAVLLEKHLAPSSFFSSLETLLPSTVRFTTLHLSLGDAGMAKIEGTGVAKSFNALAAASNAFATHGRIKDAIFSNISVKNNSVSFALSAMLDPKLITFSPNVSAFGASAAASSVPSP